MDDDIFAGFNQDQMWCLAMLLTDEIARNPQFQTKYEIEEIVHVAPNETWTEDPYRPRYSVTGMWYNPDTRRSMRRTIICGFGPNGDERVADLEIAYA